MTHSFAMSAIQALDHRREKIVDLVSIERRSKIRFPLEVRVRYRSLELECPFIGIGAVVNMSSGGVLIAGLHEITEGTRMELALEWPCLLEGQVPLQLITTGSVVRCHPFLFAVELRGHQFRTTSRKVTLIDAFRHGNREQTPKERLKSAWANQGLRPKRHRPSPKAAPSGSAE